MSFLENGASSIAGISDTGTLKGETGYVAAAKRQSMRHGGKNSASQLALLINSPFNLANATFCPAVPQKIGQEGQWGAWLRHRIDSDPDLRADNDVCDHDLRAA